METCCAQLGNGTVYVQDEFFPWCDVEHGKTGEFSDCLSSGSNVSVAPMVCSRDDDDDQESAGALAYGVPKATVSAVVCGLLVLGGLYI